MHREEENYYKPVSIGKFAVTFILNMKITMIKNRTFTAEKYLNNLDRT